MVAVEMWDKDASQPISSIELRRYVVDVLGELARHVVVDLTPWRLMGIPGVSPEELGYRVQVSLEAGGRYPRVAYFAAEDLAPLFRGAR